MESPGVIPIDDLTDPRLADYANLKDAALRDRERRGEQGVFIAEGEQVVRHLVGSRFPVRSVLLTPATRGRIADVLERLGPGVPVYEAPARTIAGIIGFDFHQGVLACGERAPSPDPLELARAARALVVCEDLANPDNVGAVFRNLSTLGGQGCGVLLSPRCCDPLYRKAVRVSMGHVLRVPFATLEPWPGGLEGLRGLGFTLLALSPGAGAGDLREVAMQPPLRPALLVGTEGPGLTEAALAMADRRVRIPMAPGTDSLNVAVALGVALSHLVTPR